MNKIADFVDAFVPKNIPKKKAEMLKDELSCHIMDKADYYMEIGYNETESVDKAIEDFGTKEEDKNFIFNEFEELYMEKKAFSIIAFIFIGIMNYLCFPLGLWVMSADYNREPDPMSAFFSFLMIFVVLLMISFARIKQYRKTLISIGVVNTLIVASVIFSFYPQMATFAVSSNIMYLIDAFTPISLSYLLTVNDAAVTLSVLEGTLLIPALYCFITAAKIKKGVHKQVKNPKKKITIFSIIFFFVAIASSILYPVSEKYIDDYPVWLESYNNCISDESEEKFNEIVIGESYTVVSNYLRANGYMTTEDYKNSLDRLTKKQYSQNLKEFDFAKGYEIWFKPGAHIEGNGFVGIKQENGVVTAKAIGNLEENIYSDDNRFGYYDTEHFSDMPAMLNYVSSLKKGDIEEDIMSKFGSEFGLVYTKRVSVENSKEINYYRIHCYGTINPDAQSYDREDSRYIELTFENGLLVSGTMYDEVYLENSTEVRSEKIV